jgi:AcrR family transcriptional regulator
MRSSVWTRETRRPAPRETLSREQIVRAAVELLDQEGLAGLSMRKLAVRLNAGATSIYWHVETKDDLLEFVIDEVYGEVDIPEPGLAGWRSGATLFAHSLRAMILRHPWFHGVASGRTGMGPNAMSLTSRAMNLIGAAGFTGVDLDYAVSSLVAYVIGTAGLEAAWLSSVNASGQSVDTWADEALAEAIKIAGDDYPDVRDHLAQWAGADARQIRSATFTFGLECLLDGFAARL